VRLLFLSPNLQVGGVERQWAVLIPRLVKRGHDVLVMTIDGRGRFYEELAAAGIEVRCLGVRRRWQLWRLRGTLALPWAPEIVVSRGVSGLVLGHYVARRYGSQHVYCEHSGPDARGRMKPLRRDQGLLVRLVRPKVDRVIAVAAAQLGALRLRGFGAELVVVIPNGVAEKELEPRRSRAEMRAEMGVHKTDFVALFMATLRWEKRADVFVEALMRARVRAPHLRGVIAGAGPEFEKVRRESKRAQGGIVLLGPRDDVADVVRASDVMCLTSDIEAMPMSVLEAMALGRPVVATEVGALSDLVVNGETGFLVPRGDVAAIADALVRLATDGELGARFGRLAMRRQRQLFSVDRMVSSYEHEFTNVLGALTEERSRPEGLHLVRSRRFATSTRTPASEDRG
jgi:glycosyltransferase involved in cell wall biosynthesis